MTVLRNVLPIAFLLTFGVGTVLAGILPPSAGHVRVAGHALATEPVKAKHALAFLPDEPRLMGSPVEYTEHLPSNLTKGSGTNLSAAAHGSGHEITLPHARRRHNRAGASDGRSRNILPPAAIHSG